MSPIGVAISPARTLHRLGCVLVAVTLVAALHACAQDQADPSTEAADGNVQGFIGDILIESVTDAPDGNLFSGLVAGRGLQHFVRE